jgi:hypothetical protein
MTSELDRSKRQKKMTWAKKNDDKLSPENLSNMYVETELYNDQIKNTQELFLYVPKTL